MGLVPYGGIESHLETLKDAVTRWLEHEGKKNGVEQAVDDDLLLHLAEPDDVVEPEQPEALSYVRRMRRLGYTTLQWSDGGFADQPHILMRELETVVVAEAEYAQMVVTNAQIAAKALKNADLPSTAPPGPDQFD